MWKFTNKFGADKVQGAGYLPIENVIEDKILAADTAVVTFDNIPQGYSHLHIDAKTSWTVGSDDLMGCRVNGDAGATNHVTQMLNAHAGTPMPGGYSDNMWFPIRKWFRAAWTMDIPDYSRNTLKMFTSKYYTTYADNGPASADGEFTGVCGGFVIGSVGPITKLEFLRTGKVFAAGSRITLYGRSVVPLPSPGSILPVTYGTSLPASPLTGQEAILVDSLTAPTYQWRFRYNGDSTSAYKWEYVGGTSISVVDLSTMAKANTPTWADVGGNTSLAVPRAGIYDCTIHGIMHNTGASAAEVDLGLSIDGVDPGGLDHETVYSGAAGPRISGSWTYYNRNIAANGVVKARFMSQLTSNLSNIKVSCTPKRVA
jgi:hypothetical protein